jgi:hypothetical protein
MPVVRVRYEELRHKATAVPFPGDAGIDRMTLAIISNQFLDLVTKTKAASISC